METLIDGLLKQFEQGKITRRQLIQSLALAAAAAPAAASAQGSAASGIPPSTGPAPWKTESLDHISYAVADYKRSTAFDRDLMGWEIKNENAAQNQCTLKIGDIGEIIIRNNRRPTHTSAGSNGNGGQSDRPP